MRAWLLNDFNGIGGLQLATVPDPVPLHGEVLFDVRFAALNPADRYLAERQYPAKPPLPHILGRDGLGVASKLGPGVTSMRVGDLCAVLRGDIGVKRPGTFAERLAASEDNFVQVPTDWSEQESAGATLVYLTAYQALTMWGDLAPDSVVLITGASGGVGTAALQLARARGHCVVALSRDSEKRRRLDHHGANLTFDPEEPDWVQSAKAALAPRRVDLAIDNVGGKLLPQVISLLGDLGKVSVVGRLAGPVPEFNTSALLFRRIRIGGVAVGALTNAESRAAWQKILQLLSRTGARPLVDSVFPFEQLPQAFTRLAQGPMGKVLLKVAE